MIRSLYSAVSGLTSHQTKMDVIGNNIANVNTYGFKSSRASFSDVYYQTLKSETAGTSSFAGNNPSTVGYGVQVASIDKDMSQGSFQSSNRTLDLALSGDGFFALGSFSAGPNGSAPPITANPDALTYTRAGNFGIDSYGNIVSNNNKFVMGTRNSKDGLHMIANNSAQELAKQELQDNNGDNKITSADYTYENTINVNELIQEAYGIYTDNVDEPKTGYLYTNRVPIPVTRSVKEEYDIMDNTVTPPAPTGEKGTRTVYEVVGFIQGDTDPDGNIYLCDKKGNYITKKLPIDDKGNSFLGVVTMNKKDEDGNPVQSVNDITYGMKYAIPSYLFEDKNTTPTPTITDDTASYNTGNTPNYALSEKFEMADLIEIKGANAGDPSTYGFLPEDPTKKGVTNTAPPSPMNADYITNNGYIVDGPVPVPTADDGVIGEFLYKDLGSFTIGYDGVITVSYNNILKAIARIEVTVFDNPEGLIENGDTSYSETAASGEGGVRKAGQEGAAQTISKKLEMSNVNLAQEFSDMIVTQRGFQANARMVTTSDSMLEELVNLKR